MFDLSSPRRTAVISATNFVVPADGALSGAALHPLRTSAVKFIRSLLCCSRRKRTICHRSTIDSTSTSWWVDRSTGTLEGCSVHNTVFRYPSSNDLLCRGFSRQDNKSDRAKCCENVRFNPSKLPNKVVCFRTSLKRAYHLPLQQPSLNIHHCIALVRYAG
jgi:hypothetical protein